jgi:hypothetical protein
MSYTLEFYNSGGSFSVGPTQERVITVELAPGYWDIAVTAYYGTAMAALDKKPQVAIRAGEANSVSFTMNADDFITPDISGWVNQDKSFASAGSPENLTITLTTSTAFTGIPGWTDHFSYRWYYEDRAGNPTYDNYQLLSSSPGGTEGSSHSVAPLSIGTGTFRYYVEVSNKYTYDPPGGGDQIIDFALKNIYVANVVVGSSYSVGDTGPAGGTIYHIDLAGFTSGGNLCHHLEVSTTNLGPAAWGASGTEIPGARGTEIGTGYDNTQAILATLSGLSSPETGKAAQLAASHYEPGFSGFTDWFLPSRRELSRLYASGTYVLSNSRWSSTETDAEGAEWIYRNNNNIYYGTDPKTNTLTFRVIRAF